MTIPDPSLSAPQRLLLILEDLIRLIEAQMGEALRPRLRLFGFSIPLPCRTSPGRLVAAALRRIATDFAEVLRTVQLTPARPLSVTPHPPETDAPPPPDAADPILARDPADSRPADSRPADSLPADSHLSYCRPSTRQPHARPSPASPIEPNSVLDSAPGTTTKTHPVRFPVIPARPSHQTRPGHTRHHSRARPNTRKKRVFSPQHETHAHFVPI